MADNPNGIVTVSHQNPGQPVRAIEIDSSERVLLTNLSDFDLAYIIDGAGMGGARMLPANNSVFLQARMVEAVHPGNPQVPGSMEFEVFLHDD